MARVKTGLNLLPVNSARQTVERARLADDVGFDFVGIPDGQMVWRDVHVALTLAAAGAKRTRLTLVPDHFVPRKAVVRPPDDCRETLDRLLESEFTQISLTPMGDVTQCLRTLGDKVLPRLRRA